MKSFGILAASSLIGSALAAVHRMPLQKVPLSEQLVSSTLRGQHSGALLTPSPQQSSHDIDSQVRALGQKYMGVRPQKHADEMFRIQDIDVNKGHAVPVSVLVLVCFPPEWP